MSNNSNKPKDPERGTASTDREHNAKTKWQLHGISQEEVGFSTGPWRADLIDSRDAETPSMKDSAPLPETIGKYSVVSVLGTGGMGRVFLARDPDLEQLVAVKTMRTGVFASEKERADFQREAVALARVRHPNVVQVFYVDPDAETPYLVMENMPGGTLTKHIDHFRDNLHDGVALIEKVARAVHHIHNKDYLHRDLKPSNVLLDDKMEPKISDFGLAKLLEHQAEASKSYAQLGTPSYMSPEQTELTRLEKISRRTDVWGLGVMLYQLGTGRLPFVVEDSTDSVSSRRELVRRICRIDPPAPRRLNRAVDRNLEAIILHCLEKNSNGRYGSAEELADELGRWRRGEPILTRPEGFARRTWRAMRRRPLWTAVAVLFACILMIGPLLWYARHPDRPLWRAQDDIAARKTVVLIGQSGPPKWRRLPFDKGRLTFGKDGSFQVESWDLMLVALMPELETDHYALHAQVKQLTGDNSGRVGVYCLYSKQNGGAKTAHTHLEFAFNDVLRLSRRKPNMPNAAYLSGRLLWLPDNVNWNYGASSARVIKDVALTNRPWHDLSLFVEGDKISATFDGHPLPPISIAGLQKRISDQLLENNEPLPPGLDAKGPLGLMVLRASALFRNVKIQPLTD